MKSKLMVSLLALAVTTAGSAQNRLFEATATTTLPANNITLTAGGNNFSDFLSALINTEAQFQQLDNRPYNASATFLGFPNAITFSTNATGTAVTMTLPPIGFSRTFTGVTSQSVDDQIDEFFKQEGLDTVSRFLQAVAKGSTVAVTDGNPNAATAVAANSTFLTQGFTSAQDIVDSLDPTAARPRFGGFALGFNAGKFEAGPFEGDTLDFSFSGLNIGMGKNMRLLTPISFNYLKVAGAQVAGIGGNLVLPIQLKSMGRDNAWNWRLTPLAGVSARASVDLAGGALLWQVGAINSVDYRVNPKLVFCFVNQLTYHKSFKLEYDEYSFDPAVNQQIMKNGVRLVSPLTRRLIGDFFVVDTRFLKDAAIDQFYSFGGSLSLRASKDFNLSLGANYDTGDNFKSYSVGLSSAWKW